MQYKAATTEVGIREGILFIMTDQRGQWVSRRGLCVMLGNSQPRLNAKQLRVLNEMVDEGSIIYERLWQGKTWYHAYSLNHRSG